MVDSILYGKEARYKIKVGIDKVCNAAKVTLGAKGRLALIKRAYLSTQGQGVVKFPISATKDGVSVVRSISLPDKIEDMGAELVREAAEKTMQQAGDATTTTCVLLQAILDDGLKMIDEGANPMELKIGIESAVESVVAQLKQNATPVVNPDGTLDIEKIKQVATISANNDSVIGDLIVDAFKIIGKDGIVSMEEAKGTETTVKTSEGVKFNKGWLSPYFITNHSKNECELINPLILLYDKTITISKPIEKIIASCIEVQRPLLIICENADGEGLARLAMSASKKIFPCCIVQSPEFGDLKRQAMEDLAIITGGTFISDEKGTGLETAKMTDLGGAKKVVITKNSTSIIEGAGSKESITDLLNELKMNLTEQEGIEKEMTEKRIAKLTGSVAVIYVGGVTEVEMREKWDRIDDAIRATKAAQEDGFIVGGGSAYLRVEYDKNINPKLENGYDVVFSALTAPFQTICKNAGVDHESVYNLFGDNKGNIGYNAKTDTVEDLVESGIIDAVKALVCALTNAASSACILLTTETAFYDFAS
jgi:chaperonin GroEL